MIIDVGRSIINTSNTYALSVNWKGYVFAGENIVSFVAVRRQNHLVILKSFEV